MKPVLRAIGAAALGFAAFLLAASTPSAASTYTLNFTGSATSATGAFAILGAAAGDPISGSMTFNPFATTPSFAPDPTVSSFTEVGAYSFHISNPTLDLNLLGGGAGFVTNLVNPPQNVLRFGVGDDVNTKGLILFFVTDGGGTALTSLAGLSTTPEGILALLGGGSFTATGVIRAAVGSEVGFTISLATATTPIPAALPLFAGGLVGLGLVARRRKRLAARA